MKVAARTGLQQRLAALGATVVATPLELTEEKPPSEFRIFRAGVNTSDKGDFVFDEEAAEMVMSAYAKKASTLTMDYEHQALADPPIEAPASAYSWIPEVRNGELWATNVKWTPRAYGLIEAREYTRFSPAFFHDRKTMRVQRILNVALTNVEALDGIEPLMAASATAVPGDRPMKKMQCKACLKALKAPTDDEDGDEVMCTACGAAPKMCSIVGLKATATEHELVTELSSIATFRTQALQLTGEATLPAALGVLQAWKQKADGYDVLATEKAHVETASLRAELTAVLDEGSTERKVPGKAGEQGTARASLETAALAMGAGKPSKEGIAWLRAHIKTLPKLVATIPTQPVTGQDGTAAVTLTAAEKELAARHGFTEKSMLAAKQQRLARLGGAA